MHSTPETSTTITAIVYVQSIFICPSHPPPPTGQPSLPFPCPCRYWALPSRRTLVTPVRRRQLMCAAACLQTALSSTSMTPRHDGSSAVCMCVTMCVCTLCVHKRNHIIVQSADSGQVGILDTWALHTHTHTHRHYTQTTSCRYSRSTSIMSCLLPNSAGITPRHHTHLPAG